MVDLDCFKLYNDTLGHPQGDKCLTRVAGVLAASASRSGDLSSRYGGEEFSLILFDTDAEGALALAEHVRSAVQALSIPHPQSLAGPVVTVSVGVATAVPSEASRPKDLLDSADQALYRAKQEGRNRVCVAG
jgi:diguanylate cyclase (GGDEF)-like protein